MGSFYSPEHHLTQVSSPLLKGTIVQLADGSIQGCDATAAEILGLPPEQIRHWNSVGFPWSAIDATGKLYPPEVQPAQITLQSGQACYGVIMGLCCSNNQWIWIQLDTEPLFRAKETTPYGVISVFMEISAPWSPEAAPAPDSIQPQLAQSNFKFLAPQQSIETILESMTDAFVALDRNWRIIYVNQATALMNQASPAELIGRSHWEVWAASVGTICEENYRRAIAEQIPVHFEFFYETRQRWYEIHAYPSIEGLGIYYHDIDDRKQADAVLQAKEEQLRFALDFAQIGSWDWSLQTNQVEWNDIHFLLLGLTPDLAAGYNLWRERVHPEDIEPVEAKVRIALETQTSYEAEYRVCYPDGSIHWLIGKGQAIYDASRQPIRMIGVIMDITARKQTEAEVYRLNHQLRQLVQVIQQLTATRDLSTIMAAIRHTARQLVGADGSTFVLKEGEFSYYADEEAISPLWRGQRFPLNACIAGWVMIHRTPAVIPDVFSDPRIPAEIYRATFVKSLVMLPIHAIAPIGAIGVYWATDYSPTPEEVNLLQTLADAAAIAIQNIHLYKDLEQRVQERTTQLQQLLNFEALLKRITDHVRDSLDERQILQTAVAELAQGLGLECCDAALYNAQRTTSTIICEFNRSLAPAEGQTFAIPTDSYGEIYQSLFQGEICQICTLTLKEMRAEQQLLSILACPIHDDQEVLGDLWLFKPAQAIFNEQEVRLVQQVANQCAIALRQSRLYQAVQSQVVVLEELNQLKDDFLSTVSHELRSPMANIKMAAKMLRVALSIQQKPSTLSLSGIALSPAQTEKVMQYLEILNQECQRETHLIDDLLDLARIDAGTTVLMPTEVYLQEWIPQVTQSFTERMQQQRQQLQIGIPPDLPPMVTDLSSLERVVTELVHNACKYTLPMETIRVTATEHPTVMKISVSNSGIEIPADVRDRIFDKFYRIPSHDPWKQGGTGLGLALVKKLVELLQGEISVMSEDNWTTFTVVLPRQLVQRTDGREP